MKVTILGSGTSTGIPMVGCHCPVCMSADSRDTRTRASLLVELAGKYVLVDTSPDLRRQALREKIPHIDAVLFTHTHAAHVNGIDDLRGFHLLHKRVIPCYGDRGTIEHLRRNFSYIFSIAQQGVYTPLLEAHVVHGPFQLFGATIVPVPLVHGHSHATGYRIGAVAYLTDCNRIPESSLALLAGLDILIIDGLRYTAHVSHFTIDDALAVAARLRPRLTVLTHLTHEVAHRQEERLPSGAVFAYDGMVLEPGEQPGRPGRVCRGSR